MLKRLKKLVVVCFIIPLMLQAEDFRESYITEKSLSELNVLAANHDAEALNELGHIYIKGLKGVEVDEQKGLEYLLQASQLNHGPAQFFVALHYDAGLFGKKDPAQAALFYKKSAENGFTPALYSLGDLYIQGQGVPKDIDKGLSYWQEAAEAGESEAQYALGFYYTKNNEFKKGFYYTELAAKQNHTKAHYLLAILYEDGAGVEKNPMLALKHFKLACEKENFPLCQKMNSQSSTYRKLKKSNVYLDAEN